MSLRIEPYKIMRSVNFAGENGYNPSVSASGNSSASALAGSTSGVNTNIGVGDTMNLPEQAGKKAGIGRTLGFA